MNKLLAVIICTLIKFVGLSQSFDIQRKFNSSELKEDLHYLFASLENIHPNLYGYTAKDEIRTLVKNIEGELNTPMTRLEFAQRVIPIVTKLMKRETSI